MHACVEEVALSTVERLLGVEIVLGSAGWEAADELSRGSDLGSPREKIEERT